MEGHGEDAVTDADPHDQEDLALFVGAVEDHASLLLDEDGHVRTWNRGAQLLLGWEADEARGQPFGIFYPPADRAAGQPQQDLAAARDTGRFRSEAWRLRKDGSEFLANTLLRAIRSGDTLRGFGAVFYDVTEQRAATTALARSELHLDRKSVV